MANAYLQVQGSAPITASYTINDTRVGGYCATLKITNTSAAPITWRASLPIEGQLTQVWNAVWSYSGNTLAPSGPAWGLTLAAGDSFTQAGFCADR